MHFLEEEIKMAEEEGLSPELIQMFKDQLAAAQTKQSAQKLYVTGSMPAPKKPETQTQD
jgi:hypothetical protein